MSAQPLRPVSPASSPGHVVRVEYLDYQDLDKHREYRFRAYGADGSDEFRLRIAREAFDDRRVRMQDGPDLCYRKLLQAIAAGVTPQRDAIAVEDVDLFSYRDDHTPLSKRRSWAPSSPATPVVGSRRPLQHRPRAARTASPRLAVASPVAGHAAPALADGQRVNHAVFGMGVTTETSRARTVVRFDRDGPKKFVTSMLELEVLSAPHTWETNRRGMNRRCKSPSAE